MPDMSFDTAGLSYRDLSCLGGLPIGGLGSGSGDGANANPFKQEGWEEWIAGVMLCEFGAFVYAAGIVTQRYALEMGRKLAESPHLHHDVYAVKTRGRCAMWCAHHKVNLIWAFGMWLYGFGSLLYFGALSFAPLALLTTLFQTVLLFNALLSRCILGERLKGATDVAAYLLIAAGIVVAGTFLPKDSSAITAVSFMDCAGAAPAVLYYVVVAGFLGTLSLLATLSDCACVNTAQNSLQAQSQGLRSPLTPHGRAWAKSHPSCLEAAMSVVFPALLGSYESIVQILLKACSNMMLDTMQGKSQLSHPVFYLTFVGIGLLCIAIVYWLRKGYGRFEAVTMLPVQMGAMQGLSVLGGLLFYQGYRRMPVLHLLMTMVGILLVLLGIALLWLSRADLAVVCPCCKCDESGQERLESWPRINGRVANSPLRGSGAAMLFDSPGGAEDFDAHSTTQTRLVDSATFGAI